MADASALDVLRDCALDSKMDQTYTPKEYADALADIPTDGNEYTDCADLIRQAQLDRARRDAAPVVSHTGGTPSASPAPTQTPTPTPNQTPGRTAVDALVAAASPKEREALHSASGTAKPVQLGTLMLQPGAPGTAHAALPLRIWLVIASLGLGVLALASCGAARLLRPGGRGG